MDSPYAGSVIVVGSANADYVMTISALPGIGETRLADRLAIHVGGKGANQAVAAARLGARTTFISAVGDDDDGTSLMTELRAEGVDTSEIEIAPAWRTGLAVVAVLPDGNNSIMVAPGANLALDPKRARRVVERLAVKRSVLLVQCEIPIPAIASVVDAAAAAGMRVVLNAAPYVELPDDVLRHADPLVLNEVEAAAMTGRSSLTVDDAPLVARELLARCKSVVITLGQHGAAWASPDGGSLVPAQPGRPAVDTTGAGDAFCGALAAALSEAAPLEESVKVGAEVGTVAVSRLGAQASYPVRDEISFFAR